MEKLAADEAETDAGELVVNLADEDAVPGVVAFKFEAVDEARHGGESAPMGFGFAAGGWAELEVEAGVMVDFGFGDAAAAEFDFADEFDGYGAAGGG